jgi:hypothetical protein
MAATFTTVFRGTTLRKHRRKILFEREKSLLPAIQVFVSYKREKEQLQREYTERAGQIGWPATDENVDKLCGRWKTLDMEYCKLLGDIGAAFRTIIRVKEDWVLEEDPAVKGAKYEALREARRVREEMKARRDAMKDAWTTVGAEYREATRILRELTMRIYTLQRQYDGSDGAAPAQRREFIMKCPAEECRGFLSTAYKCGTCEKYTCSECLVIKDGEDHTCNPDTVESAKTIRAETQPCPKCGTRIFKIDGCFAIDTPLLMWDGSYKMSQDIRVGDLLIGDDGSPRTVEELCSGDDELYEISQSNGANYTVNSKHTLVLKFSGHKKIYSSDGAWKMRWFTSEYKMKTKKFPLAQLSEMEAFRDSIEEDDTFEIKVSDYLTLSESTKKHLFGFKSDGIAWPEQDIMLDPYMLGLYLGDGINNGMNFAVCPEKDPEIIQYLLKWCRENDSELVHDETYRFRIRRRGGENERSAIERGATSEKCKGCSTQVCKECDLPALKYEDDEHHKTRYNTLKDGLDFYNLIRNKHIPDAFLRNTRENRLKLLAGLIDTDGHVCNNGKRIMLSQSNHMLLRQIEILARSLGFVTHVDTLKKNNISFNGSAPKDYPDHLRLNISGRYLSEIPTNIARKKCVNSQPNKDYLKSSITVKHVGKGRYYGWSVSGNRRFLLKDTTVLRNCDQMWCVMEGCNTAFSWRTGHIVTGVIHNPHYYEMLRKNGGAMPREHGDIPCGGMPTAWQFVGAVHNSAAHEEGVAAPWRETILESFRNLQELINMRLPDYPARPAQLMNKDTDVDYLMNVITEEAWQKKLVDSESRFARKKEIGQILQTLSMAASDAINRIFDKLREEEDTALLTSWILDVALPDLERLREFGNQALKDLGKRDHMAVPQFLENWAWDRSRILYRAAAKKAKVPAEETPLA